MSRSMLRLLQPTTRLAAPRAPTLTAIASRRWFSGRTLPNESGTTEMVHKGDKVWQSRARKTIATGKHENLKGSPRKMQNILRPIRNLAVDEALVQLKFHRKRKAVFVYNALRTARKQAINQFDMDPSRLVVAHLNATKARYLRRIQIKGRARSGIEHKAYCHLTVAVREQAPTDGEEKLGHHGRTHSTIQRTLARLAELKEAKRAARNPPPPETEA